MAVSVYDENVQKLMDILGVPKDCVEFEVRFALNEPVTATARFYVPTPDGEDLEAITKRYQMVEVDDA